jgi:hypothetical protein
MMHRSRWLATGMLLMLAACLAPRVPVLPAEPPGGEPIACTLIGCESQIEFQLGGDLQRGETYEIETCLDGDCASATIEIPDSGFVLEGAFTLDADRDTVTVRLLGSDYSGARSVSLRVDGPGGPVAEVETEVEFDRMQPNGPGCEPICWHATVRA